MKRLITVATVAVILLFAANASFAARKTKCTGAGKVFGLTAGDVPISIRLVATKANTDADIGVFDAEGDVVGLGVTTLPRWEEVLFGPLPGVEYDILILASSGPNSTCYLYFVDDFPFNSPVGYTAQGVSTPKLVEKGQLTSLARTDARYRKMLKTMEKYVEAKVGRAITTVD